MKKADARFILIVQASADYFHWEDSMKKMGLNISFRFMNVRVRTEAR